MPDVADVATVRFRNLGRKAPQLAVCATQTLLDAMACWISEAFALALSEVTGGVGPYQNVAFTLAVTWARTWRTAWPVAIAAGG